MAQFPASTSSHLANVGALVEARQADRSFRIHLPIGYGKTMWRKTCIGQRGK